MLTVASFPLAIVGAAILGLLVILAGLYVQRRGKLRTRQGAAVLATFAVVVGTVIVLSAVIALLLGARQTPTGIL
jgi:hypothetical protein